MIGLGRRRGRGRPSTGPRSVARRAPPALLWAVAALLGPSGGLDGQEDPEAAPGAPRPAGGAEVRGEGERVLPDSADALRAALERPPGEYGFDLYDGLSLPFRIALFPVEVFGHATRLVLRTLVRVGPPGPLVVVVRDAREWGLIPVAGEFGARSGVGGGLRLVRFDPVFVEGAISVRGSQRHAVGVRVRESGSERSFEGTVSFRRFAEPHFWGPGPRSRPEDAADFRWDRFRVEARGVPFVPVGGLPVSFTLGFEENWVRRGFDGGVPDLEDVADPDTLFGLGARTRYARLGAQLALDLAHVRSLQGRGFVASVGSEAFLGVDSDSRFLRWEGSATGYLPLNARQQLALRGRVTGHGPDGGRGVPFTHLAALGGDRGLRGFQRLRFRDRVAVVLLSEWRYEVWRDKLGFARTEGFMFLDAGTVAPRLDELALSDLRSSWGFGMRALTESAPILFWYAGFSTEDTRLALGFSWDW